MSESPFERPQRSAVYALGLFVVAWSLVEGTLDVAISKELGLHPLDSSIVTAGIAFKGKSTILMGLLNRDAISNADAIKTLQKIMKKPDRNDLMHSLVGSDDDNLVFNRRKNNGVFVSKRIPYSALKLFELSVEISELVSDLQKHLGITDAAYKAFFDTAHDEQTSL